MWVWVEFVEWFDVGVDWEVVYGLFVEDVERVEDVIVCVVCCDYFYEVVEEGGDIVVVWL